MAYVACNLPKGAQKRKMAVFHEKMHFSGRKAATKFLCVKTVNDKVVRHSLAYLSVQKIIGGGRPLLCKNLAQTEPPLPKANFQKIFACSTSAITLISCCSYAQC